MVKKEVIATAMLTVISIASSKHVRKAVFGTYTDDTPRSIADWLDGEILSPKDRKKYLKDVSKKKKKNKKKKGKKKVKINL